MVSACLFALRAIVSIPRATPGSSLPCLRRPVASNDCLQGRSQLVRKNREEIVLELPFSFS